MFSSASTTAEVIPYTSADKWQLLIDAVKADNLDLVKFFLDPAENEAFPIRSAEELELLFMTTMRQYEVATVEQAFMEEVTTFIASLQNKDESYMETQLKQDITKFIETMGQALKDEALASQGAIIAGELPRLEHDSRRDEHGNKLPDFTAPLPLIVEGRIVQTTYAEVMASYDEQLSAALEQHRQVFKDLLLGLSLPISQASALTEIAKLVQAKEAEVAERSTEFNEFAQEKANAQGREAKILTGLDGAGFFHIEIMNEHASAPTKVNLDRLLIQKKLNAEDNSYDLIGYWINKDGQLVKKSLKLAEFDGILPKDLPDPGSEIEDPRLFRKITSKFGCAEHFDGFNSFHGRIPERLRATPYDVRNELTSTPFPEVIIPETGNTLAHIAATGRNFAVFQFLITYNEGVLNKENAAGVLPINVQDENGDTLFHKALRKRNFDQVFWLWNHGADISIPNAQGQTPNLYEIMLPRTGDTLAHIAAQAGEFEIFRFLTTSNHGILKDRVNRLDVLPINAQDEKGNTLLHKAVQKGKLEELNYLRQQGANTSIENSDKDRPGVLDQLIKPQGITLLERAFKDNNLPLFTSFLAEGIDPLLENAEGKTILETLLAAGQAGTERTIILGFLEALLQHLSKKTILLWPSDTIIMQKYIRAEEPNLAGYSQFFENFLVKIKNVVLTYLYEKTIPRIKDHGFLIPNPIDSSYRRFELRFEDCNRVLKAIRAAIKACDPEVLRAELLEINRLFETDKARRGLTGGSSLRDKLMEVEERYRVLKNVNFAEPRRNALELAQKPALEIKRLRGVVQNQWEIILDLREEQKMLIEKHARDYAEARAEVKAANEKAEKDRQEATRRDLGLQAQIANLTRMFEMLIQQGFPFSASRPLYVETQAAEPVAVASAPVLTQSPIKATPHEDVVASGVQGVFVKAAETSATAPSEEPLPATASSFKVDATNVVTASTEELDSML